MQRFGQHGERIATFGGVKDPGTLPSNELVERPFLKTHGESISSLVSPRDNKPIVLVPFVPDNRLAEGEEPILAYEAEGVNGERMVVDSRGLVRVVKADDFARIKFAGGHKPH